MTSNTAIMNTVGSTLLENNALVDPTAAETVPSKTPKPADQASTGLIGVDPSRNKGGPLIGKPANTLIAQVIAPAVPATRVIEKWSGSVTDALPNLAPRAGGATPITTIPGVARLSSAPWTLVPLSPAARPLSQILGTQVFSVPGVPQLTSAPDARTMAVVERSLTDKTIGEFATLNPAQRAVAGTLMSAAIQALQSPNADDRIVPSEFGSAVRRILEVARATNVPVAVRNTLVTPLAQPIVRPLGAALVNPLGEPVANPLQPQLQASQPQQTPQQTAPPTTQMPSIPAYPSTGPNDPKPSWWDAAADPQLAWKPDPSKPLAGQQEPTWWKDPKMTTWLANLNVTSREFAAQSASIDINQKGPSGLTPREEWNNWKTA
jgi:hypothetical protein